MSTDMNIDFVMRTIEERDIRFVRLWFTDILGNLKAFSIASEDLEQAFDEGIGFDGSAVEGFVTPEESDMLAYPDPTTFQIVPPVGGGKGTARIFCDVYTPSREPFDGDPRGCLDRVFRAADEKGYVLMVGPKMEYFYFKDKGPIPVPLDNSGYFDLTSSDAATDLRHQTILTLEHMSVPVTYSYHTNGASQNAVELRYADARTSADNVITARLSIRQVAYANNMFASFMPKPLTEVSGSGMFLYQSLFDHEGNNLFWAPKEHHPAHLSDIAQHYVAGLLKYAPEYALITNPTVNSYKRLVRNGEVPIYATWGRKDRTALVRVPTHKPGKHQSTRVELRQADPTANPYLTFAITLAAGIRGIEEGLRLPEEVSTVGMTDAEARSMGIERLPRSLGRAIERFENSSFVREALGDHICDYLLDVKRREWHDYRSTVTDWERERYYAGI
ncbi:MAG: glutamine synthetase [Atopobiaceae bacterium]|nr:glutamine synthetase [Atopobiaceae bacterium]